MGSSKWGPFQRKKIRIWSTCLKIANYIGFNITWYQVCKRYQVSFYFNGEH